MLTNQDTKWIEEPILYVKCPRCKIGDLNTRVRRGPIVKYLLFLTDIKRYRCNNCYAKVFATTNFLQK